MARSLLENWPEHTEPTQFHVSLLLLVLGAAVTILYVVGRALYNVFFHPLRKYPGPKLWATSRIPLLAAHCNGQLDVNIQQLHKRYGPVVRIAPDELTYTSATAWKTIYGHRSVEMTKPRDGRGIPQPANGVHGIITANRETHSRQRRALAHAFSEKALREQEPLLQDFVSQLIQGLHEHGTKDGAAVNMSQWFNWATFDIIGELAMCQSFDCLKNATPHPIVTMMMDNAKSIPWQNIALYYSILPLLKYITPAAFFKSRANVIRMAYENLAARLASDTDRKDFFTYILRHNDEKGLSKQEMQTMALTLIIAGSETTATLLTGATFFLLKSSDQGVYRRLVREIRKSFQDESEISLSKLADLKYLNAFIQESLRMYSPVPGTLPRTVPELGEDIDGQWVPGGTVVGVHQSATYRNDQNFCRPNDFIPDRWLGSEAPSEFAKDDTASLQPFSLGPRNCIGRNLAWAEARLMIARILWNFDLELVGDHKDWETQSSYLLRDRKPVMVHLTPVAS